LHAARQLPAWLISDVRHYTSGSQVWPVHVQSEFEAAATQTKGSLRSFGICIRTVVGGHEPAAWMMSGAFGVSGPGMLQPREEVEAALRLP
jgi:hypothetical protein